MSPFFEDAWLTVHQGDCRTVLESLPSESVHCVVTSPPYFGLRDYGDDGQIGLESSVEEYVAQMVSVFREVRRVMRHDATLWLNLGDSYAGSWGARGRGEGTNAPRPDLIAKYGTATPQRHAGVKPKDLLGVPWRVAFALQADGWYLRSDIIWAKPNPMPESVTDRPTKSHEYLFLLSKSERYYFDADAVRETGTMHPADWNPDGSQKRSSQVRGDFGGKNDDPGKEAFRTITPDRNIRSVWTIATQPYPGAHFATFPPKLVEPCIKAGCPELGTVLDPFAGSGTTLMVAQQLSRRAIGIDLNADYLVQCLKRNAQTPLGLAG